VIVAGPTPVVEQSTMSSWPTRCRSDIRSNSCCASELGGGATVVVGGESGGTLGVEDADDGAGDDAGGLLGAADVDGTGMSVLP